MANRNIVINKPDGKVDEYDFEAWVSRITPPSQEGPHIQSLTRADGRPVHVQKILVLNEGLSPEEAGRVYAEAYLGNHYETTGPSLGSKIETAVEHPFSVTLDPEVVPKPGSAPRTYQPNPDFDAFSQ